MSGTNSGFPTPTSRRVAGVSQINIDGINYNVTEHSWSSGSRERETMRSLTGVDGYRETIVAPFIEATLRDAGNITVGAFANKTDTTVILRLANGKVVAGDGMWNIPLPEVSSGEATFRVRFEGGRVRETNVSTGA